MTSWPRLVFERRGERRRGTGRAIGVGVCEGIVRILWWQSKETFYISIRKIRVRREVMIEIVDIFVALS